MSGELAAVRTWGALGWRIGALELEQEAWRAESVDALITGLISLWLITSINARAGVSQLQWVEFPYLSMAQTRQMVLGN